MTLGQVDEAHGRRPDTAGHGFRQNRKHFEEGVDYFEVPYEEWSRFGPEFHSEPKTEGRGGHRGSMILLTESGYLLLAKSLRDDLAWKVQKTLVRSYFRVREALSGGLLERIAKLEDREATLTATLRLIGESADKVASVAGVVLGERRHSLALQENARLALAEGQRLLIPGAEPLELGGPARRRKARPRLTDQEVGRLVAVWREHVGESDRTVAQLCSIPRLRAELERLGPTAMAIGNGLMEIAGRVVGGSAVERVVTRGRGAWRIRRWGPAAVAVT